MQTIAQNALEHSLYTRSRTPSKRPGAAFERISTGVKTVAMITLSDVSRQVVEAVREISEGARSIETEMRSVTARIEAPESTVDRLSGDIGRFRTQ